MRQQAGRGMRVKTGSSLAHVCSSVVTQHVSGPLTALTEALNVSLWCCPLSSANSFGLKPTPAHFKHSLCTISSSSVECPSRLTRFNVQFDGSDLAHRQVSVIQVQGRFGHVGLKAAPPSPRWLLQVIDGGCRRFAGHFARRVSCRDRRAGVWLWLGRGSRLMKCSLSHARLRACAARDSSPPLWVGWWHGRYGRARDGGTRGAAVESGAAAVFLQQKQQEDTERARRVVVSLEREKLHMHVY